MIIEIGCNDGILLQNFVVDRIPCLGIEPSKNVAQVALDKGIKVITDFFDQSLAENILKTHKKADAIISANVMCHIPYLHSIYEGVKILLNDEGVFVFEEPYLGSMFSKVSYDQIYDEHIFMFSLNSIKKIFNLFDLLWRLPQSYIDGSHTNKINELQIGKIQTINIKAGNRNNG